MIDQPFGEISLMSVQAFPFTGTCLPVVTLLSDLTLQLLDAMFIRPRFLELAISLGGIDRRHTAPRRFEARGEASPVRRQTTT